MKDFIQSVDCPADLKKAALGKSGRDLFHACWDALIDDEFLEAWEFGFVVQCEDGVYRRLFIRFLAYSADYPEK